MTFYELVWQGEGFSDAADLEEAAGAFLELKPKELSWSEVCSDPTYGPTIRRYRSFDAFLDNEDAIETIAVTAAMFEAAEASQSAAEPPN